MSGTAQCIESFADKRVLVIGDVMLDRYLQGRAERIAQEAPVPVVDIAAVREAPGAAGNVAMNLRALGASVRLVGAIGNDPDGSRLRQIIEATGIEFRAARVRRTLTKTRVCAGDQVLLRFDEGRAATLSANACDSMIAAIEEAWDSADAVVISDYNYGAVPSDVLNCIAACQKRRRLPIAVDARDLLRYRALRPAVVKPDFGQAWAMLGEREVPANRISAIESRVGDLAAATNAEVLCVTLDCDGSLVYERGVSPLRIPVPGGGAAHTNGAGDTYLAAFALAQCAGVGSAEAARVAGAAAAVVVRSPGTATCTAAQLAAEMGTAPGRVLDMAGLQRFVETARQTGKRIVFTNGVFDVLHSGHVTYLQEAASLGDLLIVGVNNDDGVRRLKGPERPLNPLQERLAVLAGLTSVAAVVAFGEDTPERLIRCIRPDVFVKGGDYHRSNLKEAGLVESLGGTVVLAGYVPGRSTTGLIRRARSENGHGPQLETTEVTR